MFLLSDRVKNEKLLSCTWRAGPGPHAYVRKGALFLIRSRRQRDHICLRTKSDPALISAPHLPLCRLTPHTCAPCPGLSFQPGTSQFLDVEFTPWAFASYSHCIFLPPTRSLSPSSPSSPSSLSSVLKSLLTEDTCHFPCRMPSYITSPSQNACPTLVYPARGGTGIFLHPCDSPSSHRSIGEAAVHTQPTPTRARLPVNKA